MIYIITAYRLLSVRHSLQILTQLEGVIKQDYLSSNYETTAELLGFCTLSGKAAKESDPELVPQLPWIPQTTAAVALRLLELDSSIFYTPLQKAAETNSVTEAGNFTVKFFFHFHCEKGQKINKKMTD